MFRALSQEEFEAWPKAHGLSQEEHKAWSEELWRRHAEEEKKHSHPWREGLGELSRILWTVVTGVVAVLLLREFVRWFLR